MTIIYLITTVGHGKGGHFHSLNTIANEVGKTENVHVINIGFKSSEVLDKSNYKYSFIPFNGFNFLDALFKIKKIVKELNPRAIHAFDVEAFAFSRLISKSRGQNSYLNKCGGPNPKKYYPIADCLILFSKENETYFLTHNRYKKTKIAVIANRVKPVKIDAARVKLFYQQYGVSELSILRIARIGKHYHNSITQAINLIRWLKDQGLSVRLIVIGTIQSQDIYNLILDDIKSKNLENDIIIDTSDIFTHNASELLEVGDIIVGTGRNFMEACSLNKMLLVPYKDSKYPLLVTEVNFQAIFETNFSPRTQISNFNEAENLKNIINRINDGNLPPSQTWFELFFNVKGGVDLYKGLYTKENFSKGFNPLDTISNILYAVKTFVFK